MLEFYNRLKKHPLTIDNLNLWMDQTIDLFKSLDKQVTPNTLKVLPKKSGPGATKAYKEISRIYKSGAPMRYRYLQPFDGFAEFLTSIKPQLDKYKKKAFRTQTSLGQGVATVSDVTVGFYMFTWAVNVFDILMSWNKCLTHAEFGNKEIKIWTETVESLVSMMSHNVVDDVFVYNPTVATEDTVRSPGQVGRGFAGIAAAAGVGLGVLMSINTASHAYGSIKTEYQQFSDAQEHQWKLVVADSKRKLENKPDDPRLKKELAENQKILRDIQMRMGRHG